MARSVIEYKSFRKIPITSQNVQYFLYFYVNCIPIRTLFIRYSLLYGGNSKIIPFLWNRSFESFNLNCIIGEMIKDGYENARMCDSYYITSPQIELEPNVKSPEQPIWEVYISPISPSLTWGSNFSGIQCKQPWNSTLTKVVYPSLQVHVTLSN